MKRIIIAFSFVLISSTIYSQAGQHTGFFSDVHDSLLFDGTVNNSYLAKNECGCTIKIVRQQGMIYATSCEKVIYETCGVYDTDYVKTKGLVPSYVTEILDGDTIKTGDFAGHQVDLKLNDGKTIHMGQNSSIMIGKDHCKNPMDMVLHYGLVYLDLTGGDKNKTISIKTERGVVVNRGTRFTIETIKEGDQYIDIVRVYEGSVSFKQNNDAYTKTLNSKDTQMKQITEDYQSGKISLEEYAKKMGEIQQVISDSAPGGVTVNEGYESRMAGTNKPTEPVPFDVNDDPGLKK